MSYCTAIQNMKPDESALHRVYHDTQYGFPIYEDHELFCRLILEINQAGLSWTTILKKQDGFRNAYHQFEIKKIAAYKEKDVLRLLQDANIIRNKLKIHAAIENAKTVVKMQKDFGSFKNWLDLNHKLNRQDWTKLFKQTFKFTGGEIVNEFLVSTGYLEGAHEDSCAIYQKVKKLNPKWLQLKK